MTKFFIYNDLPKISLNKWYSGQHWSKRKQTKDIYKLLINQKEKLKGKFNCEYHFYFKSRPLDASNCVAMVKLIEDCLIENDAYNYIKSILITSKKADRDQVVVKVTKI